MMSGFDERQDDFPGCIVCVGEQDKILLYAKIEKEKHHLVEGCPSVTV